MPIFHLVIIQNDDTLVANVIFLNTKELDYWWDFSYFLGNQAPGGLGICVPDTIVTWHNFYQIIANLKQLIQFLIHLPFNGIM